MKTKLKITGFLLFLLLLACNNKSLQLSESQKADVENEIREISGKWLELWNKHDIEGLKSLWADDGTVYRAKVEPGIGPEAIGKIYSKEFEQNPQFQSYWKTDKVIVSSAGDYAVEYGTFADKGLGPDGTGEDYGKYVTVYKNVNGTWKCYSDIGTSTKPSEMK